MVALLEIADDYLPVGAQLVIAPLHALQYAEGLAGEPHGSALAQGCP